MEHCGPIIKKLRQQYGYKQETVADYLGVKREMISYYENGTREPSLEALEKLADLFGVALDIFFSDNPDEVAAEMAFAFRADHLTAKDMENIATFRRVIRNYHRIVQLGQRHA
ncbi:helix-turn-helix domain-containing protein [Flavihumibacter rivuli]|uniref:helix-turn-helix domain-containing protein n=1 Tax=Flavihumibacter rivuli TaxID=2838156 RepID=UPI001BDF4C05|nr:helix-turn-helix transcriptional regulator [Flavihumibacter rivuli]ULQ55827.1 helix-turn-helix domain-containing protein [Flavihumibacter rivuli]